MSSKNRTPNNDSSVLSAAAADAMLKLNELTLADLERLVTGAYRARGYEACASGGDWLLTRQSQRLLLQCKHWKTRKVSEMPVRELYGSMAGVSATGGVLISAGSFTLEATRFAGLGGIELLDGPRLLALLQRRDGHAPATPSRSMTG
jgi:restriction system protein